MVLDTLITILITFITIFIFGGIKQIMEYERGLKFTLGKYSSQMGPGLNIVIPLIQSYQRVDIRVKTIDVPKQDCITKDNVSVTVDAVAYYYIYDVEKSILGVEDFYYAISQLSQTTMRNVVGEVTLDELLANRDKIAERIQEIIDKGSDPWGLKVEKVELKKIDLPSNMQRVMAREAEAEREKRGVIIKSEGEIIASKNLAKAAEIMKKYPGTMQLRTLSTITDISKDPSQKFIFFPTDFMTMFKK